MRRSPGVAVAGLLLALVAGCSVGDAGGDGGGADSAAGSVAGVEDAAGAPVADDEAERQVVTTASASLTVDDPAAGAQRISELVEAAGGRVDGRSESRPAGAGRTEDAYADLVLRVPSDALTGLLADLEDVGEVADVSVSRSDVTSEAVDLDARISALRTSVDRLESLMDDAASTEALLKAEDALAERQADLESLQSQRTALADQVELSTLEVHLQAPGVSPAGGPDGFGDGLGTGWRSLLATGGTVLVVLGVLLPWLAVAGLVAVAVVVPLRRARRRTS